MIKGNLRKKIITGVTALILSVAAFGAGAVKSYADDPTTESGSGSTTEQGSTEEGAVKTEILNDENGRISFWEWKRLSGNNFNELLGDGKFHACMIVFNETHSTELGVSKRYRFVSLYNDRDHIFLPREMVASGWYNQYDRLVDVAGDAYAAMVQKVWGGKFYYDTDYIYYGFDQYENFFLKLDEDGLGGDEQFGISKWLWPDASSVKPVDKFFTTGGCMGVPFIKVYSESKANADIQIAISDGTAKSNPADMSYLGFGDRASRDHVYLIANKSSSEKEPITQLTDYYPWFDTKEYETHKYRLIQGGKDDDSYYCIRGYVNNNEQMHDLCVVNGWLTPIHYAYASGDAAKWSRENNASQAESTAAVMVGSNYGYARCYYVYIGTQHVFASIKGEGGDKTSGEGGVTTIDDGQMLIVGDATYVDQNNKPAQAEGIVLPEGSKIIVNKGGVLAVDGNFINNGQIICNGGTIIVKEGGCISPYRGTMEGKIFMNGGEMIIMPGGKVYALGEEGRNNIYKRASALGKVYDDSNYNPDVEDGKYYLDYIQVTNGANIVCYGDLITTRAVVDKNSKIEIRKGGKGIFGVYLKDTSVLLQNVTIGTMAKRAGGFTLTSSKDGLVNCSQYAGCGLSAPNYYRFSDADGYEKGNLIFETGATYAATFKYAEVTKRDY